MLMPVQAPMTAGHGLWWPDLCRRGNLCLECAGSLSMLLQCTSACSLSALDRRPLGVAAPADLVVSCSPAAGAGDDADSLHGCSRAERT